MTVLSRITNAAHAGINAFRIKYANPGTEQAIRAYQYSNPVSQGFDSTQYDLLWSYYTNSVFDMVDRSWQSYKSDYGLHRYTRSIYNPVKRQVDFYAGQIYPGVLSEDGEKLPEGVRQAIPFADDTPEELKAAIAQFWQWSNWQSWKAILVRWCATLGNVLVEIEDDVERGKVYAHTPWPGMVKDLQLDVQGNVKFYALEYRAIEATAQSQPGMTAPIEYYTYRKEVDKDSFRYYKNNQSFDYGEGAIVPNPYGFVPAVWFKHSDVGGMFGQPVFAGSISKINEANSIASSINDRILKASEAPMVIGAPSGLQKLQDATTKRGATESFDSLNSGRETHKIYTTNGAVSVAAILADMDFEKAYLAVDRVISEIEVDSPEISFWSRMRDMTNVSGIAIARMSGDVINRVQEAAALYDTGSIRLFQMAVSIAGFRYNEARAMSGRAFNRPNGWANPNSQQDKFASFDLSSYQSGNLDFSINPRPLINPTELEESQEKLAFWTAIKAATSAGVPLEMALEDCWPPDKIAELTRLKEEKQAAMLQQQQDMMRQQPNIQEGDSQQ